MSGVREAGPVLASDERAIEAATRVAEALRPHASEIDRAGTVPLVVLEEVRRAGLLTINVPRSAGGTGASNRTVIEVLRVLATGDPAVALLTFVHYTIIYAVLESGSPALRTRLLADVLDGARIGNAAAERGVPVVGALETRIVVGDDGAWRVSGRKHYATGAKGADRLAVAALDPDGRAVIAVVPSDADGVTVVDDWDSIGLRATESGSVVLEDVVVDPDDVVAFWRGLEEPALWLARDGLLHNAVDIGAARTALAETVSYVRERGRPARNAGVERATEDPHLIGRVGQLAARLHAAELLLDRGARAIDTAAAAEPLTAADVSVALAAADASKALGSDLALEIANEVIGLGGTRSADDHLNLHRHWRNIRTHTVHDPVRWRYHRLGDFVLNGPGLASP